MYTRQSTPNTAVQSDEPPQAAHLYTTVTQSKITTSTPDTLSPPQLNQEQPQCSTLAAYIRLPVLLFWQYLKKKSICTGFLSLGLLLHKLGT